MALTAAASPSRGAEFEQAVRALNRTVVLHDQRLALLERSPWRKFVDCAKTMLGKWQGILLG